MLTALLNHKLFLCNIVTVTLKKTYIELRTRGISPSCARVRRCAYIWLSIHEKVLQRHMKRKLLVIQGFGLCETVTRECVTQEGSWRNATLWQPYCGC